MENNVDKQYLECLKYILENGIKKTDRTGTGTLSVFDLNMRFKMSEGFPLLTSKKMFIRGIVHELIWFLKGDTNIKYLLDNDVHIWDGDCYANYFKNFVPPIPSPTMDVQPDYYKPMSKELFIKSMMEKNSRGEEFVKKWGELGSIYGSQWRQWTGFQDGWDSFAEMEYAAPPETNGVDQIQNLINDLKNNPDSRRLMVSAWNVAELKNMVLPPCHYAFQCYTFEIPFEERINYWLESIGKSKYYAEDITNEYLDTLNVPKRYLSLKWIQRSCDFPLGIPYNIASYGLLLHLLSKEVNMIPYELIFNGGDCHIYLNQIDGVKNQLNRETYKLPKIKLNNTSIFDFKFEDLEIIDYKSSPGIKFPLSN